MFKARRADLRKVKTFKISPYANVLELGDNKKNCHNLIVNVFLIYKTQSPERIKHNGLGRPLIAVQ